LDMERIEGEILGERIGRVGWREHKYPPPSLFQRPKGVHGVRGGRASKGDEGLDWLEIGG
jgi:hypothetical protein